jgi:hypothetical protein
MRRPVNIVFKPGPVQAPGSRFWWVHRVVRANFFLKKQNDVVLVKKKYKSQRLTTKFLTGSTGSLGHTRFFFLYFFFQPCPVLVPDWPGPARLAGPDFIPMRKVKHGPISLKCNEVIRPDVFWKINKRGDILKD